jgi:uncharacterized protein
MSIAKRIAKEINATSQQVTAAIKLLDGGATVPFIARYRKEVTNGLDDTQLRLLEERLRYLRDLEDRRAVILNSIDEQQLLTPQLKKSILAAETMARLEDLYLPYRPKRRTKAQIACEAGLEPLANTLLEDPKQKPEIVAASFIDADKEVGDVYAALEGAQQIIIERFSEQADLNGSLRRLLKKNAIVKSSVVKKNKEAGKKFSDYFDYDEPLLKVPSHRALAIFRGQNEKILRVKVLAEKEGTKATRNEYVLAIAKYFNIEHKKRPADNWLQSCVEETWKSKIFVRLETELFAELKQKAEDEAIRVFGENLRDLLLAAPAGQRATIGLDPGLRTGVKIAVIDPTGKVLDTATIYPHAPRERWDEAISTLAVLADKHLVELVAIGNGTASRETEKLVTDVSKRYPQLHLSQVMVSEAGASVYSASALAANEFPDMDVSLRGAVSIARRLQDPLAELVKIEPKAIGVGQYQHDMNQKNLAHALGAVVEDCVNSVGVDINTASSILLARVAGLSKSMAENIVKYRDEKGQFANRKQINKVKGIGPKSFEQAAGFLRIIGGENPLDASAVHPESYPIVEKIIAQSKKEISDIIGNHALIGSLNAADYMTEGSIGAITVTDVLSELDKPGRDPRPEFKTATFREGVNSIHDLRKGMLLEGTVTNVANFGAFVDIGVHQDGLVHISAITNKFIDDPRKAVKTGEVVKVKVLETDIKRKRISLTMRLTDEVVETAEKPKKKKEASTRQQVKKQMQKQTHGKKKAPENALAAAFSKAMKG